MTKREQTTIDPELLHALRADGASAPGTAVRERVFARIESHFAALAVPVSGAVSTATMAGKSAAPASAPPLPDVASPAASSLLASALSKPVGIAVISAVIGGAGTYALGEYTAPAERASNPPTTAAPASARSISAVASASKLPADDSPAPARPEATTREEVVRRPDKEAAVRSNPVPVPAARASAGASLGEQQALLDAARRALARGENRAVLETLNAHSSRYPDSDLVEEREALAIKALVAAGKHRAARERAARFKQRFPNSLLAPSVSAALGTIP